MCQGGPPPKADPTTPFALGWGGPDPTDHIFLRVGGNSSYSKVVPRNGTESPWPIENDRLLFRAHQTELLIIIMCRA